MQLGERYFVSDFLSFRRTHRTTAVRIYLAAELS